MGLGMGCDNAGTRSGYLGMVKGGKFSKGRMDLVILHAMKSEYEPSR